MKFSETLFIDYVNSSYNNNIHNKINKLIIFPPILQDFKNVIIYGVNGIGKYTIALNIIRKYSKSNLKYEKKMNIMYNKNIYILKFSDIHYEVDMSLLGCNSKLLWAEIFTNISEIITSSSNKNGIILCKNFSSIHNDLLQYFYNYIQKTSFDKRIFFIIITNNISFIPTKIINCCLTIPVHSPSQYMINSKIYDTELYEYNNTNSIRSNKPYIYKNISNLKNINNHDEKIYTNICKLCDKLLITILEINTLNKDNNNEIDFGSLRNEIYDLLIYNLNIYNCIWYIINKLINLKKINNDNISIILINVYTFFKYYNNNYRPIYHLEKIIIFIIINI
jgi:DNA polymerase III delta prime subunit